MVAGAWVGFNVTTDLLAVLTTIVGATAGANLALLTLDIAGARRFAEDAEETIEAQAVVA